MEISRKKKIYIFVSIWIFILLVASILTTTLLFSGCSKKIQSGYFVPTLREDTLNVDGSGLAKIDVKFKNGGSISDLDFISNNTHLSSEKNNVENEFIVYCLPGQSIASGVNIVQIKDSVTGEAHDIGIPISDTNPTPSDHNYYVTPVTSYIRWSSTIHTTQIYMYDNSSRINSGITWAISNNSYATINSSGLVTLNSNPTAVTEVTITASINGGANSCNCKISLIPQENPAINNYWISPQYSYLIWGVTTTNQATFYDNNNPISPTTWSLSDTTYAEISSNGLITLKYDPITVKTITIIATYGGTDYKYDINLIPDTTPVYHYYVSTSSPSMKWSGSSITNQATFYQNGSPYTPAGLVWSLQTNFASSIVEINSSGLITLKANPPAYANIKVIASYNGTDYSCDISLIPEDSTTNPTYYSVPTTSSLKWNGSPLTNQIHFYKDSTEITSNITWTITGSSDVSVDSSLGIVTLNSNPTAVTEVKVTATYLTIPYDCFFTIIPADPTPVDIYYIIPGAPSIKYDNATKTDQMVLKHNGVDVTVGVAWNLSNTTYATIDTSGLVTLNSNPTAVTEITVNAVLNTNTYSCKISLIPADVPTIHTYYVVPTDPAMKWSGSASTNQMIFYDNGTSITTGVTWSMTTPAAATINSTTGLVTLNSNPTTVTEVTITATYNSNSYTCDIALIPEDAPITPTLSANVSGTCEYDNTTKATTITVTAFNGASLSLTNLNLTSIGLTATAWTGTTNKTCNITWTSAAVGDQQINITNGTQTTTCQVVISPKPATKSASLSVSAGWIYQGATTQIIGTVSVANFTISTIALASTSTNFDNFAYTTGNTFSCRVKTTVAAGNYNLAVVVNSTTDNITSNTVIISVVTSPTKSASLGTNISYIYQGATTQIIGTVSVANFTISTIALTTASATYFDNFAHTTGSSTFTCKVKTTVAAGNYNLAVVVNSSTDNVTTNTVIISVVNPATKTATLSTNITTADYQTTPLIKCEIVPANFTISTIALTSTSAANFDSFTYTAGNNNFTCKPKANLSAGSYDLIAVVNSSTDNVTTNTIVFTIITPVIKSLSINLDSNELQLGRKKSAAVIRITETNFSGEVPTFNANSTGLACSSFTNVSGGVYTATLTLNTCTKTSNVIKISTTSVSTQDFFITVKNEGPILINKTNIPSSCIIQPNENIYCNSNTASTFKNSFVDLKALSIINDNVADFCVLDDIQMGFLIDPDFDCNIIASPNTTINIGSKDVTQVKCIVIGKKTANTNTCSSTIYISNDLTFKATGGEALTGYYNNYSLANCNIDINCNFSLKNTAGVNCFGLSFGGMIQLTNISYGGECDIEGDVVGNYLTGINFSGSLMNSNNIKTSGRISIVAICSSATIIANRDVVEDSNLSIGGFISIDNKYNDSSVESGIMLAKSKIEGSLVLFNGYFVGTGINYILYVSDKLNETSVFLSGIFFVRCDDNFGALLTFQTIYVDGDIDDSIILTTGVINAYNFQEFYVVYANGSIGSKSKISVSGVTCAYECDYIPGYIFISGAVKGIIIMDGYFACKLFNQAASIWLNAGLDSPNNLVMTGYFYCYGSDSTNIFDEHKVDSSWESKYFWNGDSITYAKHVFNNDNTIGFSSVSDSPSSTILNSKFSIMYMSQSSNSDSIKWYNSHLVELLNKFYISNDCPKNDVFPYLGSMIATIKSTI